MNKTPDNETINVNVKIATFNLFLNFLASLRSFLYLISFFAFAIMNKIKHAKLIKNRGRFNM